MLTAKAVVVPPSPPGPIPRLLIFSNISFSNSLTYVKKLRGDTAYLNRVLDANIEGYRAIRDAGHTILPKEDADFEGEKYRKTCLRFFKLRKRRT